MNLKIKVLSKHPPAYGMEANTLVEILFQPPCLFSVKF